MREALFEAIAKGEREKVRGMLARDPSLLRARQEGGPTTLLWALYNGQAGLVAEIEARGYELDVSEAIALGRRDVFQRLFDPAEVNGCSPDGYTLLGLAVFFSQPEIARQLMDHGADPSLAAKNETGFTPLHAAAARRDTAMVIELLRRGADARAKASGGFTPLHTALAHGEREMARALMAAGADMGAKNDEGKTPADLAPTGWLL